MNEIRNSAKAIIIHRDRLLVTKHRDDNGVYYLLPGGGQLHGETLHDTLHRECIEEIGTDVEVKELVLIREYISKNHEFAVDDIVTHQVEFMFRCELPVEPHISYGIEPDSTQIGVEWLPLEHLIECRIYPSVLKHVIPRYTQTGKVTVYLGDVN